MDESQFAERIARIRARFASNLADKIRETDAALHRMAGNESDALEAVAEAYRRFHNICGIGPTIGFEATGRSARALDSILTVPFEDRRGLSDVEVTKVREGLESLRVTALEEMQPTGLIGSWSRHQPGERTGQPHRYESSGDGDSSSR